MCVSKSRWCAKLLQFKRICINICVNSKTRSKRSKNLKVYLLKTLFFFLLSFLTFFSTVYKCVCQQYADRMYSNLIELVATYLRRVSMELQVSKVGPYQSTGIAPWYTSEPKCSDWDGLFFFVFFCFFWYNSLLKQIDINTAN